MTFGFLVAGFLATTNAGRVAVACREGRPPPRSVATVILAGAVLIAGAAAVADPVLDRLAISPESFRIAAGLVLAVAGLVTLVRPAPSGPFVALLLTPELACFAVSAGADEALPSVLGAAAIALGVVAIAAVAAARAPIGRATRFLAALQVVIGVALVVSGVRSV